MRPECFDGSMCKQGASNTTFVGNTLSSLRLVLPTIPETPMISPGQGSYGVRRKFCFVKKIQHSILRLCCTSSQHVVHRKICHAPFKRIRMRRKVTEVHANRIHITSHNVTLPTLQNKHGVCVETADLPSLESWRHLLGCRRRLI